MGQLSSAAMATPQKDYVNQLFDRADLIIAIGYDIVECAPAKWGARPDMTILHIDTAPADVNKRYQPAVEVGGDISESLYEILASLMSCPAAAMWVGSA